MREIKFRIWSDAFEKMYYPTDSIKFEYYHDSTAVEIEFGGFASPMNFKARVGHIKLMQFTGLHDKNGKEIYEGDVLQCGDRIVKVAWHNQSGTWDSIFIEYTDVPLHSNGITNVEWKFRAEVIGNIYENPELVKP